MDITIHSSFLPHNDPDASLAFYRDTLGFEVRNDVGYDGMRWITVGPPDQPDTSIVLHPPAADPGITDDERRTIAEMMAKGTYAGVNLATKDLDGTFERLQASDAEVVQEPTDQPYGVRDCAFRDPAGNMIRIQAAVPEPIGDRLRCPPPLAGQRRRDTEHRLSHDVDVWVATASAAGAPYLVPLSFDWDGDALLLATPTDSPTGTEPGRHPGRPAGAGSHPRRRR